METTAPLLFAAVVGFGHAFEADHLVAVGNIVSKRKKFAAAIKDGIYWGLGHTSTIFIIGLIFILGRYTVLNSVFDYLEGVVGFMLVILGVFRLFQYFKDNNKNRIDEISEGRHHLAYGVGLIHGLAGSGAVVLLVMTEISGQWDSIMYLLIFGLGSVMGMLVAAGLFSMPFSQRISANEKLQTFMVVLSSVICIGYGVYVMQESIMASLS